MFVLGHAGITTAVVRRFDRARDWRWIAVAALLPDLIDKPVALLLPGFANGWTRLCAHSLSGLGVFAVVSCALLGKRAWPFVLAWAIHLVLDRMWEAELHHVLLWPFRGFWLPPHPRPFIERLWDKLTNPWTVGGELAGLICLLALRRRGELAKRPCADPAQPREASENRETKRE